MPDGPCTWWVRTWSPCDPSTSLTGKDVLVSILGLVLWPLAFLPGVQEPAFLLLQHLEEWGFSLWPRLFPRALNTRHTCPDPHPSAGPCRSPEDGSLRGGSTSNSSQKPCLAFSLASVASLSSCTRLSILAALILVALRGWQVEA